MCNGTWSSIQASVLLYIQVPNKYKLHGQIIASASSSKYLGVEISDNLPFNNHIQKICTSASWSLGFIKGNISTNSIASEMAYETLMRP